MAPAEIVGVIARQQQHPAAQPVLGHQAEEALVEVAPQRLPGQRVREEHPLRAGVYEQSHQGGDVPGALDDRCAQRGQSAGLGEAAVEGQGARGFETRAAVLSRWAHGAPAPA